MSDEIPIVLPVKVRCETCLKEIPRSEATSAEAEDYVVYFCGIDCFQQWRESNDPDESET
ncbi:MAG: DUF3330 domain-containing protein [Gammaproteobacteria bacterium]|jgi:hypothetical protein